MQKLIFGALIVLSSCCISMPHREQIAYLKAPPSIDCSLNKSLETPFFTSGDWPSMNWWSVFHEPELDSLIAQALANNPTLQEVSARVELAKQEAIIVRSKLFPLITFDGYTIWEHLSKNGLYKALNPNIPTNVHLTNLSLNFNYEFDFWCKNANLFSASLGREIALEAEWAAVELLTTTALAQAFFALKSNLEKRRLLCELLEIRRNIFNLQDLLRQRALSSFLIPLSLEEKVWETEEVLAEIDAEIDANKHLINILAGKSPDCLICIDHPISDLPKSLSIPCNLSFDLLARRPDLMAQIWRAKALSYEVSAAIADFYPNVNLGAFLSLESVSFKRLFTADSGQWGMQPAFHLPIFTAGAIQANVNAKQSLFHQAIFAYNSLLLKSAQEVSDLLSLANAIFLQKSAQEKVVQNAEKFLELTVLRQKKGLNSLFDSYYAQAILIEKKLQDVTLLYNEYAAAIRLIKALGGGFHSECVPLRVAYE